LTCGELAQLLNGEKMLKAQCKLQVVKMKKWKRKMNFDDTGLQWIPTSPHIPQAVSAYLYPATGILGELGYVSIGVGYTLPFQLVAAEWIDAQLLASAMNNLQLPGLIFRPVYLKPFYSVNQGKDIQGVQIHIVDYKKVKLSVVQFFLMQEMARLYPEKAVFANADKGRFNMFDKVSGTDFVRKSYTEHNRFEFIREYWNKDVDAFKTISKKYYLY
jgi:uncharacterized protein YbbC (DUF1343 family)